MWLWLWSKGYMLSSQHWSLIQYLHLGGRTACVTPCLECYRSRLPRLLLRRRRRTPSGAKGLHGHCCDCMVPATHHSTDISFVMLQGGEEVTDVTRQANSHVIQPPNAAAPTCVWHAYMPTASSRLPLSFYWPARPEQRAFQLPRRLAPCHFPPVLILPCPAGLPLAAACAECRSFIQLQKGVAAQLRHAQEAGGVMYKNVISRTRSAPHLTDPKDKHSCCLVEQELLPGHCCCCCQANTSVLDTLHATNRVATLQRGLDRLHHDQNSTAVLPQKASRTSEYYQQVVHQHWLTKTKHTAWCTSRLMPSHTLLSACLR